LQEDIQDRQSISDAEESEDEKVPDDKIFAEYQKVNRTKLKFKLELRNAIMHLRGRDYVVKSLVGDIDY
jgi:hypothetical protein